MNQIKVLAAAKSLSAYWIPVNPVVHNVVTTKLRKGFYSKDISPLFSDLMGDLSLFGFCLRHLMCLAKDGKIAKPPPFDLISLFRSAGQTALQEILSVKTEQISSHTLDRMSNQQASCMQQTLLTSAASEVLSEKAQLPAGIGFASAFLRQVGITLIAWNYPHILRHALVEIQRGVSLDEAMLKQLGYSPRMLALAVARDWGFGDEILFALGDKRAQVHSEDPRTKRVHTASELIGKMCEIGETLAQASHPEMYPQARGNWGDAKRKIEGILGSKGLSIIEDRFRLFCKGYLLAHNEQIARLAQLPMPLIALDHPPTPESHERPDTAVQVCPAPLREQLTRLYDEIGPAKPKKEAVLSFAQKVVPVAGFSGGCIFMYDLEHTVLIPRFRFGELSLPQQRVKCSALESYVHPAAEAFRSDHPIMEFNPWSEESGLGYVVQAFGALQRVGVLYLEIGRALEHSNRDEVLFLFQTLRKALQDCLGVR